MSVDLERGTRDSSGGLRPWLFFRQFLRYPEQVGSVIPSSRFLEERLIEIGGVAGAGLVVELGPGTGGITRAMLRALPGESRLLAIELNREFAAVLAREPDPRLIVHPGSAEDLPAVLDSHGLARPEIVVSGIPFSTMPAALGQRIIDQIWAGLAPGGRFVAYQLRSRVAALGRASLGPPQASLVLRNLPPARVYCWRKPAEA